MIKKLARSIREYKRSSIATPIVVACEVVMEVLIPYFMAQIIDIGLSQSDMSYTVRLSIILIIAAIISLIFGALSGKLAAQASAGFAKNLRGDIFHHIQTFSFSNIDKFKVSSLVTRMTTDVTNVQNAYQMIIRILVRGPLMLIAALVMASRINRRLSLIFLIAIPILGFALFFIALKAHPYFEKVFRTYDKLNNTVQENVRAIRVVKSFVRADYEEKKFMETSNEVYDRFKKAEKIVIFNSPVMQSVIYISILLISYNSGKMIVSGSMTTGELMSMIIYATQILSSLMMLSMVFVMIIMARSSAERIIEVLEEESDIQSLVDGRDYVEDGSIDFKNVTFSYVKDPEKAALKDKTFI